MKNAALDAVTSWVATTTGYTDQTGGIWSSVQPFESRPTKLKPALFLDRDGVVVEEVGYLSKPEEVRLTEGAGKAIAVARASGYLAVLVTNQSGIARRYFGWPDFESVQQEIARQLADFGAALDAVYACGYHENGSSVLSADDHPWRKPSPGMILRAADDLGIDIVRSVIVGDRTSDLKAGKRAGLSGGFLVATGYGGTTSEIDSAKELASPEFVVQFSSNLSEAWKSFSSGRDD